MLPVLRRKDRGRGGKRDPCEFRSLTKSSEPVDVIVQSVLDGLHGSVSKKVVEAILKSFELCQRISLSDRSLAGVPVDEEVLEGIAKLFIWTPSFCHCKHD